ncbi:hypothetical protein B0G76_7197 [Paraburkholderia sp. BL23I1N1]|uniref:hypothetical protein n=1 Tax=Paraburkholderia sp. BL23I1N1 TaxID=1938802 RepID=UPI000E73B1CD|nr:hypothetical protein [Paraburkholderia sp. BL23I1N1]RKE25648.1 hypothetical protein B0G76_7197 [Paraburkholderia sp. BL23I1N1]
MANKDAVLKTRLDHALEVEFVRICEAEGRNASSVLRELVVNHVITHPATAGNLKVVVTLGGPSGRGMHYGDEYAISARLASDVALPEKTEILFRLPDFDQSSGEPYRVDSAHTHRAIFPSCRNAKDRLLGAKLINNEWMGALFLYDLDLIGNPHGCVDAVSSALEGAILNSVLSVLKMKEQDALESLDAAR